jgi:protein TonB
MFEDFGKNKVAVMEKVKPYEPALKEEEIEDEMLIDVEVSAEPTGGYEAFYQYIKQELKYPSQAQRMSVQGKVYVQFIIERDGSLSDVKVLKGIGAGCDEEAVRVLSQSPSWQPGKQRGRPIRQRMVMPMVFKLQ